MNKKDFDKPELNRAEMGTDPVEEAEVRFSFSRTVQPD